MTLTTEIGDVTDAPDLINWQWQKTVDRIKDVDELADQLGPICRYMHCDAHISAELLLVVRKLVMANDDRAVVWRLTLT